MNSFDRLDRGGKTRITVFTVLMLMLTMQAYIGSLFQADMVRFVTENVKKSANAGKVFIDGADISWVNSANILGAVLLGIGIAVLITAVLALGCLAVLGIFRAAALKNVSQVQEEEYTLAKRINLGISAFAVFRAAVAVAKVSLLWTLSGALLCVPMYLFGYLFYVRPLKKMLHQE